MSRPDRAPIQSSRRALEALHTIRSAKGYRVAVKEVLKMAVSPPSTVPAVTPKSTEIENLGNITGRRTNGLTTVGGGDPMLKAFNWYGKKDPPVMSRTSSVPRR